jgi:superoxide reductase
MDKVGNLFQIADWKKEKHVPVIECPGTISAGDVLEVKVSIGKEIPHPNSTGHHIRWIQIFFQSKEEKGVYQVGQFEFTAHGEYVDGTGKGPVYTQPVVTLSMQLAASGILHVISLCNIHGLWKNMKAVDVVA